MGKLSRTISIRSHRRVNPLNKPFIHNIWTVGVVLTAVFALWRLSEVCALVFATVLLYLLLRGLAGLLSRMLPISQEWAVGVVVLALLGVVSFVAWLFGSQVVMQFDLLAGDLRRTVAQVARSLGNTDSGVWFLSYAHDIDLTSQTGRVAAVDGRDRMCTRRRESSRASSDRTRHTSDQRHGRARQRRTAVCETSG